MSVPIFRALALTCLVVAGGYAFQSSPANRPWPPEVQKVAPDSPPLSPADALQTFYMPPGYRVQLVASEPLVQEPVAIDWDVAGRLWVVEMPGWMPDITAAGEHEPIGRVVVLEDENRDGRMDKRTVFAEGLVLARSIKVLERGVLVGEPPNAWLMRDTDGDLRMDAKDLVTNQYGRREVDPQNNANGFHWALDNRMYTAGQSEIFLRLKGGAFEVHRTLPRGEWGITEDDGGRIYRNTNESALHVDLVSTAYYARNPNLLRTRGSYERLATDNEDLNIVWPVRPNPGTNRAYQTGIDRADGTLAKFTSVCAPLVYRGDRLPAELYGNVFIAEPAANLIGRLVLEDDGTRMQARKAYERGEFLASTDERFRPVYFSEAPDGTLYVVDLYRGIIEHRISITEYLRDQILARKLEQPVGMGRIYRIVHETTRRDASPVLTDTASRLVEMLSHPNGWRRDTAQRLLVERGDRTAIPALVKLAQNARDWRLRLRALWILDGLDAIEPSLVATALKDEARDVRAAAIRIAERWLADPSHPIQAAVLARLDDRDWQVRQQLAASIGVMPAGARESAAASLLQRHGDDAVAVDAALSGLRGTEPIVLRKLLEAAGPNPTPQFEAAITMLTATSVRSAQEAAIQNVFTRVADTARPHWQRSALLRGVEVALLGAAMPAQPSGRRSSAPPAAASLPCPTCPGGRAGPGGAYAFPRPETTGRQGAGASASLRAGPSTSLRAGRGAGGRVRLTKEPTALTAVAAGGDELTSRAAKVLDRVAWPGKPGETAIPPLSPEEQQRFDLGRDVYRNICQACHQADGRGQDRLAPSLVDSVLTLAAPEITARILLNGKEGPIGLMPPIGAAITDEQIASVLTYVRREWGQTGTPVDPETVKTVRALTAGRARPWKHDELMGMVGQ